MDCSRQVHLHQTSSSKTQHWRKTKENNLSCGYVLIVFSLMQWVRPSLLIPAQYQTGLGLTTVEQHSFHILQKYNLKWVLRLSPYKGFAEVYYQRYDIKISRCENKYLNWAPFGSLALPLVLLVALQGCHFRHWLGSSPNPHCCLALESNI